MKCVALHWEQFSGHFFEMMKTNGLFWGMRLFLLYLGYLNGAVETGERASLEVINDLNERE